MGNRKEIAEADKKLTPEQIDLQNAFLDNVLDMFNLKNDAALSAAALIAPPMLSKMRHGRLAMSADVLITMHELTGKSIAEIKQALKLDTLRDRIAAAKKDGTWKEPLLLRTPAQQANVAEGVKILHHTV